MQTRELVGIWSSTAQIPGTTALYIDGYSWLRAVSCASAAHCAAGGAKQLPYQAGFVAGKAFLAYRKRGGERRSPLPGFCIGAHAAVSGYRLLTRDAARYRAYFSSVELIAP